MPDNQRSSSASVASSLSSSVDNLQKSGVTVIRKVINSAIYVEKPIMPPLRKTSPILIRSDSGYTSSRTFLHTDRSVKKCTCISSKTICACHDAVENKTVKSGNPSDSSTSSDGDSQITVKSNKLEDNLADNELRLSLCSLPTERTDTIDPKEKEEMIKCWLHKKDKERKKKELGEAKAKEEKEKRRQMLLEKEKENYKKWLEQKKKQEEKARKQKGVKEKEEKMKEAEKEKKVKENEASYSAWLNRKKRTDLEKKIKDKLSLLKMYEDKQRRLEENEKAFNEWLKNSKDKPKPIPLNKGLESLCSSMSVTYINPVPWIPNVEMANKPSSQ